MEPGDVRCLPAVSLEWTACRRAEMSHAASNEPINYTRALCHLSAAAAAAAAALSEI